MDDIQRDRDHLFLSLNKDPWRLPRWRSLSKDPHLTLLVVQEMNPVSVLPPLRIGSRKTSTTVPVDVDNNIEPTFENDNEHNR